MPMAGFMHLLHDLQGTFRNRQGYFNETWCEDTFGQYAQSFF
jgi:hypothetical protein